MNPLSSRWSRPWRAVVCAIAIATLTACGGGGDDEAPPVPAPPPAPINPTGRGEFLQSTPLANIAPADIATALAADGSRVQNAVPRYDVATWRVEYNTLDADGKASPVLSYQHGTIFRDAEAPSNNAVPSEVSVVLASMGYIVLASDYVGFGASRGTPHPYLLAAPTAAAVNDFITATQYWRAINQVKDNGELFLTGYSKGAYATLAAHRALQAENSPALKGLRMSVVGSGPYDVQATLDGLIDLVRKEQPILGALIDPGFLRLLGSSVRRDIRRALLRELLPDDADVVYDTRFLDSFLADDKRAIAQDNSVFDWRPQVPVVLFHGRDDRTVPYASSARTLDAMKRNGAGDDLVSLTDCRAVPAGHIECVAPFIEFMLGRIGPKASGL